MTTISHSARCAHIIIIIHLKGSAGWIGLFVTLRTMRSTCLVGRPIDAPNTLVRNLRTDVALRDVYIGTQTFEIPSPPMTMGCIFLFVCRVSSDSEGANENYIYIGTRKRMKEKKNQFIKPRRVVLIKTDRVYVSHSVPHYLLVGRYIYGRDGQFPDRELTLYYIYDVSMCVYTFTIQNVLEMKERP